MANWRAYFDSSGADIWTVIQQAIVLAATDFPAEFKERRCDIAEMVFDRTKPQSTERKCDIAEMVSDRRRPEFKEKRCDIAEMVFDRRRPTATLGFEGEGEGIICSSYLMNNRTFRFEADARANVVNGGEEDVGCQHFLQQHTSSSFLLPNSSIDTEMQEQSTIKLVDTIKKTLDDPLQAQSEILGALQTLESMEITVEVLKRSEIGKHVSNLRKHSVTDIQVVAKRLIRQWKELVDDWVSKNAATGASIGGIR